MNAIRAGYKQTEAGMIPEDWVVAPISSVTPIAAKNGIVDGPFGSNLKTIHYRKSGIPIVTSGYVTDGKFFADKYLYVDQKKFNDEKRSAVRPGDIVMAKIGERCGASAILPAEHEVGILSGNALKITVDPLRHSTFFIWQVLWDLYSSGDITLLKTVGAQPAISMAYLKKYLLALPPTKAEQEAIAEALSDADALIESLEQLLTKKRHLTQAAMQELLTGKKRLPGFSGEWEVKRLGNVCSITTGKKDVNEGNPVGQYPFFTCARTNTFSDSYSFEGEAILIAGNGEVGNLSYCDGKFEAYQRTYVLQSFTANVGYLWQQLSAYLADSLGIGKIGSSIPYIKMGNLIEFEFRSPHDVSEQIAIAAALSDMDAELADLEAQLDKSRALKQGMMQKLLTGEIRLV